MKKIEEIETYAGNEPLGLLKKAIIKFDSELAKDAVGKALAQDIEPMQVMEAMTEAIQAVGVAFSEGELFLPDLIGASDAFSSALPLVEEEIQKTGTQRSTLGTVVIGSVYGDYHTIGKAMVITLMRAGGFEVHDLGVNVKADDFVKAVISYDADLLGMSALMSTTIPEQGKVIKKLEEKGLKNKVVVMVGGGAVTQEYADSIGADGYGKDAFSALEIAKKLAGN